MLSFGSAAGGAADYDDDNCSASANRLVPINSLFPDSVSRPRVSQVEVTYSDSYLRQ